jgi:predicted lipoprotein with Yx(FWY)xxD motif
MQRAAPLHVATLGTTLLAIAGIVAACGQSGAAATPTGAPAGGGVGAVQIGMAQDAKLGPILTGAGGKTLYVRTSDSPGVTTCTGACVANWPPLLVTAGQNAATGAGATGTLATMTRPDGTTQVTYNGAPLYYFAGDTAAGMTNGQGFGGVWYAASPAGGPNKGGAGGSGSTPAPAMSSGYGY